jgi:hypothetical protein
MIRRGAERTCQESVMGRFLPIKSPWLGARQTDAQASGTRSAAKYPYEMAKAKATQVVDFARKHRHPFQCHIERKQQARVVT